MDEEDRDVTLELADENQPDTERADDDAARLLIEVREPSIAENLGKAG